MARHSIAGRSTVAGTASRAGVSLFATAANGGTLREVGVTNTTTTAFVATLARFTAATNVGTGLTEADYDRPVPAVCTGFAGHTGDGTTGQILRQASIGAAIGAGVIWTFGDSGIRISNATGGVATSEGIGVTCGTGTGQIFDYWLDWDE